MLEGYQCNRCDYIWAPKRDSIKNGIVVKVCPKCKSPYWNSDRKLRIRKKSEREVKYREQIERLLPKP